MRLRSCPALSIALVVLPTAPRIIKQESSAAVRVLFPADKTILDQGHCELLCVVPTNADHVPRLRIDGKPGRWEPTAPPVLLARLDLAPGPHTIRIDDLSLRVYVRGSDPPAEEFSAWLSFRSHPGGEDGWKDCGACHEVNEADGRQVIGALRGASTCQSCHSPEDFQLAHFHPEKPLAGCQECHALHGSQREALLRAPAKELCARCHD